MNVLMTFLAKLKQPSMLIMIAANLLPLIGVLFWGWDVFLLLVLYWFETAIMGFWIIVAILIDPYQAIGPTAKQTSRTFLVLFLTAHAGVFMGVHFMFLWALFAGDWTKVVHGPFDFVRIIVIGSGLWIPLIALFISRGVSTLLPFLNPDILPVWLAAKPVHIADANPFSEQRLLGGFYRRIIIMHLTLIFSGFVAGAIGSVVPLVLMIALKIAIELKLHLRETADAKPVTLPAS
jgi:Family of unknown function (DUF6498)